MCLLLSKMLVKTLHVSANIVTIFRGCIYSSFYIYYARHMYPSSLYWLCGNILSIYVLLCRFCLCHVRLRTHVTLGDVVGVNPVNKILPHTLHVCGRILITGLTSASSTSVDISSTSKVEQKLGVSLPLLKCSTSA